MRTKRWTSDCGKKWHEIREDGTVHSFKGTQLKIYEGKGAAFALFYLIVDGQKKRFYIPMKKTMVEYFVENPNGYKYFKFIDEDKANFHYTNLKPVRTQFESLTTESQLNVLAGRKAAEAKRREENERLRVRHMEANSVKSIISNSKGGKPVSSVALRRARTREKFFGYEPRIGLFGKELRKEEPKYDSNFKLRK